MCLKKLFDGKGNQHQLDSEKIGDLADLSTDVKETLVAALNEIKNRLPKVSSLDEGAFIKVSEGALVPVIQSNAGILICNPTFDAGYYKSYGAAYGLYAVLSIDNISLSLIQSVSSVLYQHTGNRYMPTAAITSFRDWEVTEIGNNFYKYEGHIPYIPSASSLNDPFIVYKVVYTNLDGNTCTLELKESYK